MRSAPNREIVSFRSCVRAGGRRARDQSRLPRGICRMMVPAAAPAGRPACFGKRTIISRKKQKVILFLVMLEHFSHKSSIRCISSVFSSFFFCHYWRRRDPPVLLRCPHYFSKKAKSNIVFSDARTFFT